MLCEKMVRFKSCLLLKVLFAILAVLKKIPSNSSFLDWTGRGCHHLCKPWTWGKYVMMGYPLFVCEFAFINNIDRKITLWGRWWCIPTSYKWKICNRPEKTVHFSKGFKNFQWPAPQKSGSFHELLEGWRHCRRLEGWSWLIDILMSISLFYT